jgi:hypothetical protein
MPTPFLPWRAPVRLVGRAPREAGRRHVAPQAGRRRRICSGSAVANTPPPSGCYPQLVRPPRAPATPPPTPRHCLRIKVSRQQFFFDNKQQVLIV